MASSPPELQLQRMGTSLVFVQPMEDGKASGSSVMIELQSGVSFHIISDSQLKQCTVQVSSLYRYYQ